MSKPLVNYHVHDSHSLLDGAAHTKDYIRRAKELGHPAVAISNHGSATSIFAMYKLAKEQGIKPIIGCEFYITTDTSIKLPNRQRETVDRDKHLIILVKNDVGYKNFCKLNYLSLVEGFYYKPRITYDQLFENKEGLIITSACGAGQSNQLFVAGKVEESEEWFKRFKEEFGEDFYAEIQLNELTAKCNSASADGSDMDQKKVNGNIIHLAKKYNVKVLLGADSHYAIKEDQKLQDVLINCLMRKSDSNADTQSFIHAKHLYFPGSDDYIEWNTKFGYDYDESFLEQCWTNSLELNDKCNFDFNIGANNYPKFPLPEGVDHTVYATQLAYEGLQKKLKERQDLGEEFSDELVEEYEKRLDYEIEVISNKGYIDYFLVFWDLVKWAKKNGIYCGPGRGCFLPNSLVRLFDGSVKEIQNIQQGDKIIGRFGEDEVEHVWIYEVEEELVKLTLENGKEIICTFDHEILTTNRGYVKAIDLTEEDNLQEIS